LGSQLPGATLLRKRSTSASERSRSSSSSDIPDDVPKGYRLDLISSTALSSGLIELQHRRHR
jgi:hypothetical protein